MFEKFRDFMQDRHGFDKLGLALLVAACIISFISRMFWLPWLYIFTLILDALFIYRFLSRKEYARSRENKIFNEWFADVKEFFQRDHRNNVYYKCPVCKTRFSVIKNGGNTKVVCPKCKNTF